VLNRQREAIYSVATLKFVFLLVFFGIVNSEMEIKPLWPIPRYYISIYLHKLRKTIKTVSRISCDTVQIRIGGLSKAKQALPTTVIGQYYFLNVTILYSFELAVECERRIGGDDNEGGLACL
jgi:hypothetical protein